MMRWKQAAALALAGVLAAASVFPALAVEKPSDMDDATWARLQDNVLEYDEIENLVVYYNPVYRQVEDSINVNITPLTDAVAALREDALELRSDARKAKDDGDTMNYMINTAVADAGQDVAKSLEKAAKSVDSMTRSTKNQIRRTMTSAIQQMVIGYHTASSSKELLDGLVEMYDAVYQSTVTQQGLGMATAADVQSAQAALVSAQNSQKSVDDALVSLKQNLCYMTGWAYDAQPEIGQVPAPDLNRIDAMNPEVDVQTAISYNPTIIEQRSLSGNGDVNRNYKFRALEETEAKIKTQVEVLYQAVIQAKTAYDAACSTMQNAQITMDSADRMYSLGMVGRLEYLQMKVGYLQQKMTYDSAVLSLTQAMETYDWALHGVITLD